MDVIRQYLHSDQWTSAEVVWDILCDHGEADYFSGSYDFFLHNQDELEWDEDDDGYWLRLKSKMEVLREHLSTGTWTPVGVAGQILARAGMPLGPGNSYSFYLEHQDELEWRQGGGQGGWWRLLSNDERRLRVLRGLSSGDRWVSVGVAGQHMARAGVALGRGGAIEFRQRNADVIEWSKGGGRGGWWRIMSDHKRRMRALREALKSGPSTMDGIKNALANANVGLEGDALIKFLDDTKQLLALGKGGQYRLRTSDEQRVWLLRTKGPKSQMDMLGLFENNGVDLPSGEVGAFRDRHAHLLDVEDGSWRVLSDDERRIKIFKRETKRFPSSTWLVLADFQSVFAKEGVPVDDIVAFARRHPKVMEIESDYFDGCVVRPLWKIVDEVFPQLRGKGWTSVAQLRGWSESLRRSDKLEFNKTGKVRLREPLLVDTSETFAIAEAVLDGETEIALDCEWAQGERLSVVAIATRRGVNLVLDAQKLKLQSVLRTLISSTAIKKVIHDARRDAAVLQKYCGGRLQGVYDTQIARRWIGRMSGESDRRIGLGDLLREAGLADLEHKAEVKQMYIRDPNFWARRPLSRKALLYAKDDAAQLLELKDRLQRWR